MKTILSLALCLLLSALPASAQIAWTGMTGTDVFEESNWDFSNSTVTAIDPNVAIDDNLVVA